MEEQVSFGGDVLSTLVAGLREFRTTHGGLRRRSQPAVLGCSPWLSDAEVVDELSSYSQCCVVISKDQQRNEACSRLHRQGPGFDPRTLPNFSDLAPRVDGRPLLVGPSSTVDHGLLGSVRVAGRGRRRERETLPLVHAKVVLVGLVHETDEGPLGHVEDNVVFEPQRVWMGSANLTYNARRGVEFGMWSGDRALVEHARDFLADLAAYSEPLGSDHLDPAPEYLEVEYDDEAMAEAYTALLGAFGDDAADDEQS